MARPVKSPRQKKREIHYALDFRDGEVFLVQRAGDARLMAKMWELPELAAPEPSARKKQVPRLRFAKARNDKPSMTVRHSITVTDYTVQVWRRPAPQGIHGEWVPVERAGRVALTGLARKILRKANLIGARGNYV
jgi:adenine-specific DNA glycosylase